MAIGRNWNMGVNIFRVLQHIVLHCSACSYKILSLQICRQIWDLMLWHPILSIYRYEHTKPFYGDLKQPKAAQGRPCNMQGGAGWCRGCWVMQGNAGVCRGMQGYVGGCRGVQPSQKQSRQQQQPRQTMADQAIVISMVLLASLMHFHGGFSYFVHHFTPFNMFSLLVFVHLASSKVMRAPGSSCRLSNYPFYPKTSKTWTPNHHHSDAKKYLEIWKKLPLLSQNLKNLNTKSSSQCHQQIFGDLKEITPFVWKPQKLEHQWC